MKEHKNEFETLQKAVADADKAGDAARVAKCYYKIGIVHQKRYEYDKALWAFQKSLETAERAGDIAGVAKNYHGIGVIYQKRSEYDRALDFFQKALELAEKKAMGTIVHGA